jgi:hypothetical protein
MDRREFMKTTAGVAGVGMGLYGARRGLAEVAGKPGKILGANARIGLGIVGTGGRGRSFIPPLAELAGDGGVDGEIVGVCDLWQRAREKASRDVQEAAGRAPVVYRRHEEVLADAAGV